MAEAATDIPTLSGSIVAIFFSNVQISVLRPAQAEGFDIFLVLETHGSGHGVV